MKRAEQMAWAAMTGLLVIMVLLITGGAMYHFTAFWAGAMLAGGQGLIVGLAAWGLGLARQAAELNQYAGSGGAKGVGVAAERPAGGFRMSAGDDTAVRVTEETTESRTLETGFQRLLVISTGIVMLVLGMVGAWLAYRGYAWGRDNPDQTLAIVGWFDYKKMVWMDELCLLIGLSAALIYGVFYWLTRPNRDRQGFGEATGSTFAIGITGMGALAGGVVLGYLRVSYASEVATGVMSFFMLLQGLELLVNAFRSYSNIEELDQEPVDLQATPLTPMLGSVWLAGLRMLFAQSVGISGEKKKERGVVARMMPRALLAILVIAIGCSCFRVVPPGQKAVLERMGDAPMDANHHLLPEAILGPGLHMTLPWPMDELVYIPTEELQLTEVGTELHSGKAWKGVDFQFWTVRDSNVTDDTEDLFLTGDSGAPQMLETFVQVRWRVKDAAHFYSVLSHSDFFDKSSQETKTLPIYEAIVQQCTSFAVTRTFAIHSLEQIMIDDRKEVEEHCREILQSKLDSLGKPFGLNDCGIVVDYLTIKDLHPPYARPDRPDQSKPILGGQVGFTTDPTTGKRDVVIQPIPNVSQVARGPASAFEFVISMREFHETIINMAKAEATKTVLEAQGYAASEHNKALEYEFDKVARAHGDADRLTEMTKSLDKKNAKYELQLMEQQLLYATLKDLMGPVNKIIVDPSVKDVEIYQSTDKGLVPVPR